MRNAASKSEERKLSPDSSHIWVQRRGRAESEGSRSLSLVKCIHLHPPPRARFAGILLSLDLLVSPYALVIVQHDGGSTRRSDGS